MEPTAAQLEIGNKTAAWLDEIVAEEDRAADEIIAGPFDHGVGKGIAEELDVAAQKRGMIEENGAKDDAVAEIASRVVKFRPVTSSGGDGRMKVSAEQFDLRSTLGKRLLDDRGGSGGFTGFITSKSRCGSGNNEQAQ